MSTAAITIGTIVGFGILTLIGFMLILVWAVGRTAQDEQRNIEGNAPSAAQNYHYTTIEFDRETPTYDPRENSAKMKVLQQEAAWKAQSQAEAQAAREQRERDVEEYIGRVTK